MTGFAFATGAFPWGRSILATPIPYAMMLICFVVVTPAYLLLWRWVRLSLWRFVGIALLVGFGLFLHLGTRWNWHEAFLTGRGPLWCFGFPLAGALAYWAVLKAFAPDLQET